MKYRIWMLKNADGIDDVAAYYYNKVIHDDINEAYATLNLILEVKNVGDHKKYELEVREHNE